MACSDWLLDGHGFEEIEESHGFQLEIAEYHFGSQSSQGFQFEKATWEMEGTGDSSWKQLVVIPEYPLG